MSNVFISIQLYNDQGKFDTARLPKEPKDKTLFEKQPVFAEPIINFVNCEYIADSDPGLAAKLASERKITDDIIQFIERLNQDAENTGKSNHFQKLLRLCLDAQYREKIITLYTENAEAEKIKKSRICNLPFYFYDKKHLDQVENLVSQMKSPRNLEAAQDVVNGFKKVISEFKLANP